MAVDLDPALREILACPCPAHAELRSGAGADPGADGLSCTACGRWDPITGVALTSLRVAGGLYYLLLTSTTIAAAGARGLYFLPLCRDSHPDRCPVQPDMAHRPQPG
jgi:hypothetical protein